MDGINTHRKFSYIDLIIILILLYQDTLSFEIFSISILRLLIIFLFFSLILYYKKNDKKINLNFKPYIVYLILCIYSLYRTRNTSILISCLFLAFELVTFNLYIGCYPNKKTFFEKITSIIYITSLIIAIMGIIQYLAYILDLTFLYDFSYLGFENTSLKYLVSGRMSSIYSEPAHLCAILGAGFFISLYYHRNHIGNKNYIESMIILLAAVLSLSVITYISVALFAILYIAYKNNFSWKVGKQRLVIGIFAVSFVVFFGTICFSFINNNNNQNKTFSYLTYKITNFLEDNVDPSSQNYTTFAIKSNFNIALKKMNNRLYLGTGIFSHELTYESYMISIYGTRYRIINSSDASSLFIRIFSEMGIVGMVLFLYFYIQQIRTGLKNKNVDILFMITLFISQGMRLGNYTAPFLIITCLYLFFIKEDRMENFNEEE